MLTETINTQQQLNNDNLYDESTFRPWQTVRRGRSTCTANPIKRKDIAQVLHERNLLHHTKVIQISSNLKYASIQFETSMIMETFCTLTFTNL